MKELYTAELFYDVYTRIIFRIRQLYKSKKSDSLVYLSNPFEKEIFVVKKRVPEEEIPQKEDIKEEPVAKKEVEKDDDFFDEYDMYADDDEKANVKSEAVNENEKTQKEKYLFSKFAKLSIDGQKTWIPFDFDTAFDNFSNENTYVSDICNAYCLKLNYFNTLLLLYYVEKYENEYEFVYEESLSKDYYVEPSEGFLTGVRLKKDDDGNIISRETIKMDSKEFFGNKFTEVFPDEEKNLSAKPENPRTAQHRKYLEEHAEELNIEIFGTTFEAKGNEKIISNLSALSKLSNVMIEDNSFISFFKSDMDKINTSTETIEEHLEEIRHCFNLYFPLLGDDDFKESYRIYYEEFMNDQESLDLHRALPVLMENFYKDDNGDPYIKPYFDNLLFSQYLFTFIGDIPAFIQEYKQYQENTNDYSGSFIGGGFGAKSALKGMLTASVANYAEEYIHSKIEYNSMAHKYVEKALKEFAVTDMSKQFIINLITIDTKFTMQIIPYFSYERIDEFSKKKSDNEALKDRAIEYLKANQYYAVYLAKKYDLQYIPRFTDDNKMISRYSKKELLEKAICTYPFESEFYSAYLDECGIDMPPLGFAKLMRIFDIDDNRISDIENKEAEEYKRIETEKAARAAWEAAEKARQEEERRQREAEQQKKYDELAAIYGQTYHNHKIVFNNLLDNNIFEMFFKRTFESSKQLISEVDRYLADKNIISAKLFTNTSAKFKIMLQKAKASYVKEPINDEDVLLLVDATVFGNGKNGFILTKNAIYLKGMLTNATKYGFENIEHMSSSMEGIVIGKSDYSMGTGLPGSIGEIGKIVSCVIANQMYINENGEK